MSERYDTIVLGLGAMGSATLYQLAKRGNKVLGIDQFSPPHTHGSSHGDTRITRLAIGEGAQYSPLALRSHDIWKEIEEETGKDLLTVTGGLVISSDAKTTVNHVEHFFRNTVAAAEKFNIRHDLLSASDIRKRFPQFNVQDDEVGYFEYDAGFLRPEACIEAQLSLAEKHGAEIQVGEKVLSFTEEGGIVRVQTDKGMYEASRLIVSAGPWLPTFLEPEHSKYFAVRRQVLYWFDIKDSFDRYTPDRFPVFIWELQGDKHGIYGFPAIDGPGDGLKIASEQYITTTTPDALDREVSAEEVQTMYEDFVAPYFPNVSATCLKTATCLYTITPDGHFVIDTHPKYPSVIIASPCSGHGFKHSAAIGEALAQIAIDGKSTIDISSFKMPTK